MIGFDAYWSSRRWPRETDKRPPLFQFFFQARSFHMEEEVWAAPQGCQLFVPRFQLIGQTGKPAVLLPPSDTHGGDYRQQKQFSDRETEHGAGYGVGSISPVHQTDAALSMSAEEL